MNRHFLSLKTHLTARKLIITFTVLFFMLNHFQKLFCTFSFAEQSLPANFYIPD